MTVSRVAAVLVPTGSANTMSVIERGSVLNGGSRYPEGTPGLLPIEVARDPISGSN